MVDIGQILHMIITSLAFDVRFYCVCARVRAIGDACG